MDSQISEALGTDYGTRDGSFFFFFWHVSMFLVFSVLGLLTTPCRVFISFSHAPFVLEQNPCARALRWTLRFCGPAYSINRAALMHVFWEEKYLFLIQIGLIRYMALSRAHSEKIWCFGRYRSMSELDS